MVQESLFITLALEQISHFTSPFLPREEADKEQQLFMARVSQKDEDQLLREYLNLPDKVFYVLSPQVHTWFLKRLLTNYEPLIRTERVPRLVSLYLQYSEGLVRHKVVEIFYSLDHLYSKQQNSSTYLLDIVKEVQSQASTKQALLLEELTDILIDVSLQAKIEDSANYNQESEEREVLATQYFGALEQLIGNQAQLFNFREFQDTIRARVVSRFNRFDKKFLRALLDTEKSKIFSQIVDNLPQSDEKNKFGSDSPIE